MRRVQALLVTYLAIYVVLIALGMRQRYPTVGELAYFPFCAGAGIACLYAGARTADRRDALGWRAIAAGWLISLLANSVAFIPEVSPSVLRVADTMYLAYYPLVALGFLAFFRLPDSIAARARVGLDLAVTAVAATSLAWYFVWSSPDAPPLLGPTYTSGVIPIGEILLLLAATASLHRPAAESSQRGRSLAAYAMLATAVGDLMLVLTYHVPRDPRVLTVATILIAGGSAALIHAAVVPGDQQDRRLQSPSISLPFAGLICVSGVLLLNTVSALPHATGTAGLTIGMVLLAGLSIVRLLNTERDLRREIATRMMQEARFSALVHGSRDALLVVDGSRTVRFANAAADALLDRTTSGLLGKPLSTLDAEVSTALVDAIASSGSDASRRWTWHRHGTTHAFETVAADLSTAPDVGGHLLVTRDVSERARLESDARLASRVDAVAHLSGSVAHELTNLLTVVRVQAESLGALPGAQQAAADIDRAARQGADLSRRLLAIGRHAPVAPQRVDLSSLLLGRLAVLERIAAGRVTIETRPGTTAAAVLVDSAQVEQALDALVSNAVEASPAGGRVIIHVEERGASGSTDTGPRVVALVVEDEGVGIAPSDLPRLREMFFSTKGVGHAGLGLAIAEGAAVAARGQLRIERREPRGTMVALEFPVAPAPADERARSVARRGGGRTRLLIVDDEAPVRSVIAKGLVRLGFEVETAADGIEALAVLERDGAEFDALISDIAMPRLDGVGLSRRVRERQPTFPIVLMSGYLWQGDPASETSDGIPRVAKPLRIAELLELLERMGVRAVRDMATGC